MKPIVVDASALLAWLLADDAGVAALFDRAVRDASQSPLHAPTLLRSECANALAVALRRGRITGAQARQAAFLADQLPIEYEPQSETVEHLLGEATAHGLTAYDALYLRTAIQRGAALLTADIALAVAARAAGVEVLAA